MMEHEKLTLNDIRERPVIKQDREFRASDFLTEDEQEELREVNARGRAIERPYDEVDSYCAELLARFGWDAYQAWLDGRFDPEKAMRFMAAERARQKREMLPLEAIILSSVAGANHPTKNKGTPKGLKQAQKIIKSETKQAKGIQ